MQIAKISLAFFTIITAGASWAAPFVEPLDRGELDWSKFQIKFYGLAKAGDDTANLRGAEKQAWSEGTQFARGMLRNLVGEKAAFGIKPQELKQIARQVSRESVASIVSYDTTYFTDGSVQVSLSQSLTKAVSRVRAKHPAVSDRSSELLSEPKNTGIIFVLRDKVAPLATYQITDRNGEVLYSPEDIAPEAFNQNLMGRWFNRVSKSEIEKFAGLNPVTLQLTPGNEGTFVVDADEWRSAIGPNHGLLHQGKIIFDIQKM